MEIIDNYQIGNSIRIGSNTVIPMDIPDDCVVIYEKKIRIMPKSEVNNSIKYLFK